MTPDIVRSPLLGDIPHGFLGRRGGSSEGALSGLNVGYGSGDDPAAISENRRRAIAAILPDAKLVTVHQVHSDSCVIVDRPWPEADRPRADAMATGTPGLLLGILTADCAPVLLADREARVIGAAHAGWRGALAGVIDSTVEVMESLGAKRERIAAAIGPCFGQRSYEVDADFRERFVTAEPANGRFFTDSASRPHFDLEAYVAHRLQSSGISHVERLGLDTYTNEERFFSYRRATHRCEPSYGRQISMIALPV